TTARVALEQGVEDRVRDLVADLVGMTLGHRLGGEESSGHAVLPSSLAVNAALAGGPQSRTRGQRVVRLSSTASQMPSATTRLLAGPSSTGSPPSRRRTTTVVSSRPKVRSRPTSLTTSR